jgi:hypothetical protein
VFWHAIRGIFPQSGSLYYITLVWQLHKMAIQQFSLVKLLSTVALIICGWLEIQGSRFNYQQPLLKRFLCF